MNYFKSIGLRGLWESFYCISNDPLGTSTIVDKMQSGNFEVGVTHLSVEALSSNSNTTKISREDFEFQLKSAFAFFATNTETTL